MRVSTQNSGHLAYNPLFFHVTNKKPKACWAICLPPVFTIFSLSGNCGENNLLDAEESVEGENAVKGRA